MEKYLNDDCISIINAYNQELTKEHIKKILFEDLFSEFDYDINNTEIKCILSNTIITFKRQKKHSSMTKLEIFQNLLLNWLYLYSHLGNNPTDIIIYQMFFDFSKYKILDFEEICDNLNIYKKIQEIFLNDYKFSDYDYCIIQILISKI